MKSINVEINLHDSNSYPPAGAKVIAIWPSGYIAILEYDYVDGCWVDSDDGYRIGGSLTFKWYYPPIKKEHI